MPLKSLTKKIQDAAPEIMELKFGCRVEIEDMLGENQFISLVQNDLITVYYYHPISKKNLEFTSYKKGFTRRNKIIGKDITLEDVLRAIGEQGNGDHIFDVFYNKDIGNVSIYAKGVNVKWQLGLPLHEQDIKTIKKLNEII